MRKVGLTMTLTGVVGHIKIVSIAKFENSTLCTQARRGRIWL